MKSIRSVIALALASASLSACVVAPPSVAVSPHRVIVWGGGGHHHRHHAPPPVYAPYRGYWR